MKTSWAVVLSALVLALPSAWSQDPSAGKSRKKATGEHLGKKPAGEMKFSQDDLDEISRNMEKTAPTNAPKKKPAMGFPDSEVTADTIEAITLTLQSPISRLPSDTKSYFKGDGTMTTKPQAEACSIKTWPRDDGRVQKIVAKAGTARFVFSAPKVGTDENAKAQETCWTNDNEDSTIREFCCAGTASTQMSLEQIKTNLEPYFTASLPQVEIRESDKGTDSETIEVK